MGESLTLSTQCRQRERQKQKHSKMFLFLNNQSPLALSPCASNPAAPGLPAVRGTHLMGESLCYTE